MQLSSDENPSSTHLSTRQHYQDSSALPLRKSTLRPHSSKKPHLKLKVLYRHRRWMQTMHDRQIASLMNRSSRGGYLFTGSWISRTMGKQSLSPTVDGTPGGWNSTSSPGQVNNRLRRITHICNDIDITKPDIICTHPTPQWQTWSISQRLISFLWPLQELRWAQ